VCSLAPPPITSIFSVYLLTFLINLTPLIPLSSLGEEEERI
jgi:hypothetical protein